MSEAPLRSHPHHGRPIIGITAVYRKTEDTATLRLRYTDAILRAGGIPVILPYTDAEQVSEYAACCDGILFSGGGDIAPALYGQQRQSECDEPECERDRMELALFHACVEKKRPMLGICRGIQLLCVAAGGTLCQHRGGHSGGVIHTVHLPRHTLLSTLFSRSSISVNSFHHQCVEALPKDATVLAHSEDGVIEAFSLPVTPFCVGVQWHPERMEDSPEMRALFGCFLSYTRA